MALVNQDLVLDVVPGPIPPILHLTEYDENMEVVITLQRRGQPFQIPTGTTVKIEGTLKGHPFSENGTPSGNTVTFTVSKNMTAYSGRAWTKIKLTQNSKPVSTCGFWLDCDRAGVEAEDVLRDSGFQEQINEGVAEYFDNDPPFFELPSGGQSGQALLSDGADGAFWGEAGIPEEVKTALLNCFENVAWIGDDGQTYYDALEAALYPPVDVLSISAVFTQGSAVIYDTDSLDTLKQYLVVTATMTDSTTRTITSYTLSGTLTEGTSVITVSYGGKTTTFNVVVTGTNKVIVENGAVSISDGSESDNDMRARTDFITCTNRVFALDVLINTFNVASYVARYYDANKQYIGHSDTSGVTPQVVGSGWLAGNGTEYTDATSLTGTVAYVRFLMRTTAGTETITDVSGTITVDGTEYNVLYS